MRRWRANGQNYAVEWLGEPVVTGVEKAFARACADAGLDDGVPHTLTRAAATWLVASGTPFETTADFLGMTVETLTRTYRHHAPVLQREVAEAIRRKPKRSTNRSTVANRTTAP